MPHSIYPTKNATAGRFLSRGEDYIHFLDSNGNVMFRVNNDGYVFGGDFGINYGTPQSITLSGLKQQFDTFMTTSLPSQIDEGTF